MKIIRIDLKKFDLFEDLANVKLECINQIYVADPYVIGTRLVF